ncbi:MAG TPA: tRNA dihydrouridine(20/20a) synthase DusA [Rhodobiaceae bacterium]|nr:tRNA dihydrouridine(20/20a) synthase DusA [Rhodobiaceae bacterium]
MNASHKFCVAPMMDWTDRHDRFFLRLISRHARLYTEMVTADAIRHGDRARLLDFDAAEQPLALQLGGSDPAALSQAARIGEDWGYDEINLNVGCPSDRVQSGAFGACLMRDPDLVATCMDAMRACVQVPVTVKCRIGVDDQNPEEALPRLVSACHDAGVEVFIIHARKAWLEGLSPKENRDIPPLDYALVHALKRQFPKLTIVINGGIETMAQTQDHLTHVDGVMVGRMAYKNPYFLVDVDRLVFGATDSPLSRDEIVELLIPYAEQLVAKGIPLHALTRHLMGLYQGCPGGRLWRRYLSENAVGNHVSPQVLRGALDVVKAQAEKAAQIQNAAQADAAAS